MNTEFPEEDGLSDDQVDVLIKLHTKLLNEAIASELDGDYDLGMSYRMEAESVERKLEEIRDTTARTPR